MDALAVFGFYPVEQHQSLQLLDLQAEGNDLVLVEPVVQLFHAVVQAELAEGDYVFDGFSQRGLVDYPHEQSFLELLAGVELEPVQSPGHEPLDLLVVFYYLVSQEEVFNLNLGGSHSPFRVDVLEPHPPPAGNYAFNVLIWKSD